MNAADVLCYQYEADYHCTACAIKRFGQQPGSPILHPWIADDSIDSEGNTPAPVFGDSEWWDTSSEVQTQALRCCDCQKVIDFTREHLTAFNAGSEWSPDFQPLILWLERFHPEKEGLPWEYMGTDERGTFYYREREVGNSININERGLPACIHTVTYL